MTYGDNNRYGIYYCKSVTLRPMGGWTIYMGQRKKRANLELMSTALGCSTIYSGRCGTERRDKKTTITYKTKRRKEFLQLTAPRSVGDCGLLTLLGPRGSASVLGLCAATTAVLLDLWSVLAAFYSGSGGKLVSFQFCSGIDDPCRKGTPNGGSHLFYSGVIRPIAADSSGTLSGIWITPVRADRSGGGLFYLF